MAENAQKRNKTARENGLLCICAEKGFVPIVRISFLVIYYFLGDIRPRPR